MGFGQAKVADPALDLSPFLSLPERAYASAIDSYENTRDLELDDAMYTRMLLMSELAIPRWLMHGIRTHNPDVETEAHGMLDELARQIEADPELRAGLAWSVTD